MPMQLGIRRQVEFSPATSKNAQPLKKCPIQSEKCPGKVYLVQANQFDNA
jgi:hypothetical protein